MKTPQFQLIDHGWIAEFLNAAKLPAEDLLIVSPFIKVRTVERLTRGKRNIRVLTRLATHDWLEGVSDLAALRHLVQLGAEVRGIKNLHAKLYVFGDQRAILTSANLTDMALTRNHELGVITNDSGMVHLCRDYFDRLWASTDGRANSLTLAQLKSFESELPAAGRKRASASLRFHDYGADLGFLPDPPPSTLAPTVSGRAFVKFFATNAYRRQRSTAVFDEISDTESHWALSYPTTKRPRQPKTGEVMFISTMVHSPRDHLIYGRAIAYQHQPGRDDASAQDIRRIDWKRQWGAYIRIREPEFIAGNLENGVSLNEMMADLGADSFISTAENRRLGSGNTNPRLALQRKAHMPLTPRAADWLNSRFYQALARHGRIPLSELERLYWPDLPLT
jgi:hypothetical protein